MASADNHSARSNTAYGLNKRIKNTDAASEVKESLVFPNKNRAVYIKIISPALTTDTDNPVRIIYRNINIAVITNLGFFLMRIKESNRERP